jgi:hypothetical protein
MEYDVIELLKRLADKPGLYIGKPSMTRLRAYVGGYGSCLEDHGGKFIGGSAFDDYVVSQYQCHSTIRMTEII